MPKDVTINISEFTFISGKKKNVKISVDGKDVLIPVDEGVYAYFREQFLRQNPTQQQRKRFATVMNVLRAAYLKGVSDGKK